MKIVFIFFWGFFLIVGSVSSANSQEGFFSIIPDLPLMDGLEEISTSALIFDNPEGRIISIDASGKVPEQLVIEFYSNTLPQPGWIPLDGGRFIRENELLRLVFEKTAERLVVRFSLSPLRTVSP